jgi:hypothetical protein
MDDKILQFAAQFEKLAMYHDESFLRFQALVKSLRELYPNVWGQRALFLRAEEDGLLTDTEKKEWSWVLKLRDRPSIWHGKRNLAQNSSAMRITPICLSAKSELKPQFWLTAVCDLFPHNRNTSRYFAKF